MELVLQVGFSPYDLNKLNLLDQEHETAYAVMLWTLSQGRYSETGHMAKGIDYYYYVRGIWDRKLEISHIRIKIAQVQGLIDEEMKVLSYNVELSYRQGDSKAVAAYLDGLRVLAGADQLKILPSVGFYLMDRKDFAGAMKVWRSRVQLRTPGTFGYAFGLRWLAECLRQTGNLEEAKLVLQDVQRTAQEIGHQRTITFYRISLAAIHLDEKDLSQAELILWEAKSDALKYQDRPAYALIQNLFYRLHTLRSDLPAARAALAEAIDLFERLGMRRELAEAREELARLEATPGVA